MASKHLNMNVIVVVIVIEYYFFSARNIPGLREQGNMRSVLNESQVLIVSETGE